MIFLCSCFQVNKSEYCFVANTVPTALWQHSEYCFGVANPYSDYCYYLMVNTAASVMVNRVIIVVHMLATSW